MARKPFSLMVGDGTEKGNAYADHLNSIGAMFNQDPEEPAPIDAAPPLTQGPPQPLAWHAPLARGMLAKTTPGEGETVVDPNNMKDLANYDIVPGGMDPVELKKLLQLQQMGGKNTAATLKDKDAELNKNQNSSTQVTWATPKQVTDTAASFSKIPQLKTAQEDNDQLKRMIAEKLTTQHGPNLAPLATFADALTGGKYKLAQGYKPPRSAQDEQDEAIALAEKVQGNNNSLANQVLTAAKDYKSGSETQMLYNQLLQEHSLGLDPTKGGMNPTQAANQWNNQIAKSLKDSDAKAEMMGTLKTLISEGNPANEFRIRTILASMDAHGRPNQAEVTQEAGDTSLVERAKQAWEQLSSGHLTPHNRALYLSSLQTLAQYENRVRQVSVDRLKGMGLIQYGQTPDQVSASLTPAYVNKYQDLFPPKPSGGNTPVSGAKKAAPAKSGGDPGMDAFLSKMGKK